MKALIVMAAALMMTIGANAQNIHRTNVRQTARIHQGVRNGSITPREHAAIARQRKDVRIATRVAKADGVITPAEHRIIRREQRQANATIYRAKHNGYYR
ncbi:hypothetical protein [Rurimicrobium arvi]|uniref:DUF4148 domain-containing protein n=1 Tax=Rurimicrobium arvi TaxID=2049916 RepID=A0ABP8N396_9BACT